MNSYLFWLTIGLLFAFGVYGVVVVLQENIKDWEVPKQNTNEKQEKQNTNEKQEPK